jgi:nucleoside phosphorylase/CheY-like chemotaxis protein
MKCRVLIVDDNAGKTEHVRRLLAQRTGENATIMSAATVNAALSMLSQRAFDLMIVDLALPIRSGEDPVDEAGMGLLAELVERDKYFIPTHIVGLTEHEDLFERLGPRFADRLWSLVLYRRTSDEWASRLLNLVDHIVRLERRPESGLHCDVCVITALRDPELRAVLDIPWDWKNSELLDESLVIHRATARFGTRAIDVVAASAPSMGMVASAVLATRLIQRFSPRYLFLAGICAGISADCQLGDAVVAATAWDWQAGKRMTSNEGGASFLPAPDYIPAPPGLIALSDVLSTDAGTLAKIAQDWPGPKPERMPRLHIGPVASGATVLADAKAIAEIRAHNRKVVAVEMEAYGVYVAARMTPPMPRTLAIKAASDDGTLTKGDTFRAYASFVSARTLEALIGRIADSGGFSN